MGVRKTDVGLILENCEMEEKWSPSWYGPIRLLASHRLFVKGYVRSVRRADEELDRMIRMRGPIRFNILGKVGLGYLTDFQLGELTCGGCYVYLTIEKRK